MPDLQEVAAGITLVQIPIPVALREVNCYVLAEPDGGVTIVDCGFHLAETEEHWRRALAGLGRSLGDIRRIVVTHYHPDHYGAAGWLQEQSGAPVLMPAREQPQVHAVWGAGRRPAHELGDFLRRHGLPEAVAGRVSSVQEIQRGRVDPQPAVTWLNDGEPVEFGGRTWEPIWTPGHTPGLTIFWSAADGILLADDMILAKITPNISLWPGMTENPLRQFLASLERVADIPARLTLPGHRRLITDLGGRAREIMAHHAQRLDVARQAVAAGQESAWEVSRRIFGEHEDPHNIRFALAETLAHLEYLVEEGELVADRRGDTVRYRTAG